MTGAARADWRDDGTPRIDLCSVDFRVASHDGPLSSPELLLQALRREILPVLSEVLESGPLATSDAQIAMLEIDLGTWPEDPDWRDLRWVLAHKLRLALAPHLQPAPQARGNAAADRDTLSALVAVPARGTVPSGTSPSRGTAMARDAGSFAQPPHPIPAADHVAMASRTAGTVPNPPPHLRDAGATTRQELIGHLWRTAADRSGDVADLFTALQARLPRTAITASTDPVNMALPTDFGFARALQTDLTHLFHQAGLPRQRAIPRAAKLAAALILRFGELALAESVVRILRDRPDHAAAATSRPMTEAAAGAPSADRTAGAGARSAENPRGPIAQPASRVPSPVLSPDDPEHASKRARPATRRQYDAAPPPDALADLVLRLLGALTHESTTPSRGHLTKLRAENSRDFDAALRSLGNRDQAAALIAWLTAPRDPSRGPVVAPSGRRQPLGPDHPDGSSSPAPAPSRPAHAVDDPQPPKITDAGPALRRWPQDGHRPIAETDAPLRADRSGNVTDPEPGARGRTEGGTASATDAITKGPREAGDRVGPGRQGDRGPRDLAKDQTQSDGRRDHGRPIASVGPEGAAIARNPPAADAQHLTAPALAAGRAILMQRNHPESNAVGRQLAQMRAADPARLDRLTLAAGGDTGRRRLLSWLDSVAPVRRNAGPSADHAEPRKAVALLDKQATRPRMTGAAQPLLGPLPSSAADTTNGDHVSRDAGSAAPAGDNAKALTPPADDAGGGLISLALAWLAGLERLPPGELRAGLLQMRADDPAGFAARLAKVADRPVTGALLHWLETSDAVADRLRAGQVGAAELRQSWRDDRAGSEAALRNLGRDALLGLITALLPPAAETLRSSINAMVADLADPRAALTAVLRELLDEEMVDLIRARQATAPVGTLPPPAAVAGSNRAELATTDGETATLIANGADPAAAALTRIMRLAGVGEAAIRQLLAGEDVASTGSAHHDADREFGATSGPLSAAGKSRPTEERTIRSAPASAPLKPPDAGSTRPSVSDVKNTDEAQEWTAKPPPAQKEATSAPDGAAGAMPGAPPLAISATDPVPSAAAAQQGRPSVQPPETGAARPTTPGTSKAEKATAEAPQAGSAPTPRAPAQSVDPPSRSASPSPGTSAFHADAGEILGRGQRPAPSLGAGPSRSGIVDAGTTNTSVAGTEPDAAPLRPRQTLPPGTAPAAQPAAPSVNDPRRVDAGTEHDPLRDRRPTATSFSGSIPGDPDHGASAIAPISATPALPPPAPRNTFTDVDTNQIEALFDAALDPAGQDLRAALALILDAWPVEASHQTAALRRRGWRVLLDRLVNADDADAPLTLGAALAHALARIEPDAAARARALRYAFARIGHAAAGDAGLRQRTRRALAAILPGMAARAGAANQPIAPANDAALPGDLIVTECAGVILLHPFLKMLFDRLDLLTRDGRAVKPERLPLALAALRDIDGRPGLRGCDPLHRRLLALSPGMPAPDAATLDDAARDLIDGLLRSVIAQWGRLGQTSHAGLRETFLQRPGTLRDEDGLTRLRVTPGPFDMLMDSLPWQLGIVKLPWMPLPCHVSWRDRHA